MLLSNFMHQTPAQLGRCPLINSRLAIVEWEAIRHEPSVDSSGTARCSQVWTICGQQRYHLVQSGVNNLWTAAVPPGAVRCEQSVDSSGTTWCSQAWTICGQQRYCQLQSGVNNPWTAAVPPGAVTWTAAVPPSAVRCEQSVDSSGTASCSQAWTICGQQRYRQVQSGVENLRIIGTAPNQPWQVSPLYSPAVINTCILHDWLPALLFLYTSEGDE